MKKLIFTFLTVLILCSVLSADENIYTGKIISSGDADIGGDLTVAGEVNIQYEPIILDMVEGPISPIATPMTATKNDTGGTLPADTQYCYLITYYTAEGETGTMNRDSDAATAAGNYAATTDSGADDNSIDLAVIPVSEDPRVIGRKVYRTDGGTCSNIDFVSFIATISNNVDTTWTDTGFANTTIIDQHNTTGGQIKVRVFDWENPGTIRDVIIVDTSAEGTVVGFNAGLNNSGIENTYLGYRAGEGIATGAGGKANVGIGASTLQSIDAGTSNVGVGSGALLGLTTGSRNIGMSSHALQKVESGDDNVCIGSSCGLNLDATISDNTVVGSDAFVNNDTGEGNTIFGYAGGFFLEGTQNTLIGKRVAFNMTTMDNSTLIGFEACDTVANCGGADKDNILFIHNADSASPIIGGDMSAKRINLNASFIRRLANSTGHTGDSQEVISVINMLRGVVVRTGLASGAVTDISDTATNIADAIPFCEDSISGFEFWVYNDSGDVWDLEPGSGVTMIPTGNIPVTPLPVGDTAHFMVQVTLCTGTPAVVIRSLGVTTP